MRLLGDRPGDAQEGDSGLREGAGGATTGSAGIAAAATINIFYLTTTAYIADNAQINKTTAANGSVTVRATNTTRINSVTGSIGIGLDGAGVGAGLDLLVLNKDTRAYIGSGASVDASSVLIEATSSEDILSIAGNAGVGSDAGIAGSASVQVINTGTRAYIDGGATVNASGNVGLGASGVLDITMIGGALGAASTAGVGAANTTLVHNDTVQAFIGNGASVSSGGATGILLSATSSEDIITIAASAGAAGTAGVAGSASVTVLDEATQAFIGRSATITATSGSVALDASDDTSIVSVAGSLAAAGTAAVGIGADVGVVTKKTEAYIESGVTATVEKDIVITATSSENITSVAAGLAASGTVSIALDASVHVLDIQTRAFIGDRPGDGLASAGAGNVHAGGNILISADESSEIDKIVGVLAVSGTAGIGAAGAVTVIDKTTEAFIGEGAKVTADGKWSDAAVMSGALSTAITVTFFYALVLLIWKERFSRPLNWMGWLLLASGVVRLVLMMLPGNEWNSTVPPQPWSLVRTHRTQAGLPRQRVEGSTNAPPVELGAAAGNEHIG